MLDFLGGGFVAKRLYKIWSSVRALANVGGITAVLWTPSFSATTMRFEEVVVSLMILPNEMFVFEFFETPLVTRTELFSVEIVDAVVSPFFAARFWCSNTAKTESNTIANKTM